MSHPGNALQQGIYNRLVNYAPLVAALGGPNVFDYIPQGTASPYVRVGDETHTEWDTKDNRGWDTTMTIHAFVFEAAGQKQVKTILGLIYDALHQQETSVTVTGFNVLLLNYEFDHSYPEPGVQGAPDKYWHGVMRFRCVVTL